jgi:hypothetical protein
VFPVSQAVVLVASTSLRAAGFDRLIKAAVMGYRQRMRRPYCSLTPVVVFQLLRKALLAPPVGKVLVAELPNQMRARVGIVASCSSRCKQDIDSAGVMRHARDC